MLSPDEISGTEVLMSADLGANFSTVADVPPTDPQTVTVNSLPPGDYIFRFIVSAFIGGPSDDFDFSGNVPDESAPLTVTDVVMTLS